MFTPKCRQGSYLLVFLLTFAFDLSVQANEGSKEAAKPEAHAEAKGGAAAPPAAGAAGSKGAEKSGNLPEWVELQNKLIMLEAKIKSKKANIERLIEEKQHLPNDSAQVKAIIKELVKEHKELTKLKEDYDQESTVLRYRFPEKGGRDERKFEAIEVKSLQEIEQQMGIDGRLTRTMKKVRSQYGIVQPNTSKDKKTKTEVVESKPLMPSELATPTPAGKPIEDSDVIILRK